jgi:hypothetical protein
VTIHDSAEGLCVELQLLPRPAVDRDAAADRDLLSRFTELIPPRVEVATVDPIRGEIRLLLP